MWVYNNYNRNMNTINKALLRISSGYRINSAAGLASEHFNAGGTIRHEPTYAHKPIDFTTFK